MPIKNRDKNTGRAMDQTDAGQQTDIVQLKADAESFAARILEIERLQGDESAFRRYSRDELTAIKDRLNSVESLVRNHTVDIVKLEAQQDEHQNWLSWLCSLAVIAVVGVGVRMLVWLMVG